MAFGVSFGGMELPLPGVLGSPGAVVYSAFKLLALNNLLPKFIQLVLVLSAYVHSEHK